MNTDGRLQVSAVLLGVVIQLLVLGIAALEMPLWARHPVPQEMSAIQEMLAVQVGAGAVLFPWLMGNWRTSIVLIALAWPFDQLAGLLSLSPRGDLFCASLFVSIWIAGLAVWAEQVRGQEARFVGNVVAVLFTFGGVVLWYVGLESVSESGGLSPAGVFGPLLGVMAVVDGLAGVMAWGEVGAVLVTGMVWALILRLRNAPPNRSTSAHIVPIQPQK